MPSRLRLLDFLNSDGPSAIGECPTNLVAAAKFVNAATERLLYAKEAGDAGWWGSWAEMIFTVTQDDPYITTPRDVARIEAFDICSFPVPIENQFYEYLQFGFGHFPKTICQNGRCQVIKGFDRGVFPSWVDLEPPNKFIRVYMTNSADVGKRVLIQGLDVNQQPIYSLDGLIQVRGEFLTFTDSESFVDSQEIYRLTGIQKDVTIGQVNFYSVDSVTGDTELILIMEPSEKVASYRRYFINNLPKNCCSDPETDEVQVKALVKLDFIPVVAATDYVLINNLQALIHECQAVRYSRMDAPEAKQEMQFHHTQAIRLLQGQLVHTQGKLRPALSFKPFGSAALVNQGIGTMI